MASSSPCRAPAIIRRAYPVGGRSHFRGPKRARHLEEGRRHPLLHRPLLGGHLVLKHSRPLLTWFIPPVPSSRRGGDLNSVLRRDPCRLATPNAWPCKLYAHGIVQMTQLRRRRISKAICPCVQRMASGDLQVATQEHSVILRCSSALLRGSHIRSDTHPTHHSVPACTLGAHTYQELGSVSRIERGLAGLPRPDIVTLGRLLSALGRE